MDDSCYPRALAFVQRVGWSMAALVEATEGTNAAFTGLTDYWRKTPHGRTQAWLDTRKTTRRRSRYLRIRTYAGDADSAMLRIDYALPQE